MSSGNDRSLIAKASAARVDAFLNDLGKSRASASHTIGRLLFALDATGSRQATWDQAAHIQSEMFLAAASVGGLKMQVCFYRGFGEFKASAWLTQAEPLLRLMNSVTCRAGETQITKVLQHAWNEALQDHVNAVVFIGDCVEEPVDSLAARAGQLGALSVPVFMFHEGSDKRAALAFQEIARLSGGAYARFDSGSPDIVRDLLCAVAIYAAGGRAALLQLAQQKGDAVRLIAHQMHGR